MINFIKNIAYYLFHEVIETNFFNFVNELKKGNSFSHILQEHEKFLDKCLKESFLSEIDLMNNMNEIVRACHMYSSIIIKFYNTALQDETLIRENEFRRKESKIKESYIENIKRKIQTENELIQTVFITSGLGKSIEDLGIKFEKELEKFLDHLSKLSCRSEVDHLGKLLTKLDLNNYYFEKFSRRKFFN